MLCVQEFGVQCSSRLSVVYSMLQCEVVCNASSKPVLQLQYLHQLVLRSLGLSPVLPAALGMLYQRSLSAPVLCFSVVVSSPFTGCSPGPKYRLVGVSTSQERSVSVV